MSPSDESERPFSKWLINNIFFFRYLSEGKKETGPFSEIKWFNKNQTKIAAQALLKDTIYNRLTPNRPKGQKIYHIFIKFMLQGDCFEGEIEAFPLNGLVTLPKVLKS